MQYLMRTRAATAAVLLSSVLAACGKDGPSDPSGGDGGVLIPASCPGINLGPAPTRLTLTPGTPATMRVVGSGLDTNRYTGEVAVRGNTAYTTSWGTRRAPGNKVSIWDVSGDVPTIVDSLIVSNASTTGDVAVSDDGSLLVVATEFGGGSIVVYDLANPRKPQQVSRFTNANTNPGVHTAEIGRVNGKLYAFLSVDPGTQPARIVIVDLSTPSAPREVFSKVIGNPYVHDTYVRGGLLFLALWNDGLQIWDIGGCGGTGGSPEAPRTLGTVRTLGGQVHNVWWYHDPGGSKRYAFIGQEGAGSVAGSTSSGDIHVVDLSDPLAPKEVAFYHVDGAGTHNFSVDETNGVLYAAYYNAGVRALDIRGDLGTCAENQKQFDAGANLFRCDLRLTGREIGIGAANVGKRTFVWGVQYLNGFVYGSDMLNGIWKLGAVK